MARHGDGLYLRGQTWYLDCRGLLCEPLLGSFLVVLRWGFDRMSPALYDETAMEPRPRTRRRVETYRGTIAESLQRPDARRHRAFVLLPPHHAPDGFQPHGSNTQS
jgi:hypothetical protein